MPRLTAGERRAVRDAELAASRKPAQTALEAGNRRSRRSRKNAAANQARFLEIFGQVGNVTTAARQAGLHRNAHYAWMAGQNGGGPDYEARFGEAKARYDDFLRSRFHDMVSEASPRDLLLHPVGLIALARSRMPEFAAPEVAVQVNNQLNLADLQTIAAAYWSAAPTAALPPAS